MGRFYCNYELLNHFTPRKGKKTLVCCVFGFILMLSVVCLLFFALTVTCCRILSLSQSRF